MMLLLAVIIIIGSYLIGSLPFGYLIGKMKGLDIRQQGSGNIGTTNVWRVLGPAYGIIVFLGDFGKGALACYLGNWLGLSLAESWTGWEYLGVVTGTAAIIGHSWSIFLRFSGGKIIATAAGVILALSWPTLITILAVWGLTLLLFRYISLSSLLAAIALPLAIYIWEQDLVLLAFAILAALIALFKHWPNVKRLAAGKEFKLGSKTKA